MHCQRYFTLCLIICVSDSLIPLYPALHISPCFVRSVCLSQTDKKNPTYLQPSQRKRECSISAAQIKSGLDFPQTLCPQHSVSFRKKEKGERVCERHSSSYWLYFRTLQINCCTLTFKTSLIELSVACQGMLGSIALILSGAVS